MELRSEESEGGRRWDLPGGEAVWVSSGPTWLRPGLDDEVTVPLGTVTLTPTLGDELVVVHLDTPVVVAAGDTWEGRVAWPVVLEAHADGRLFDRFRPGMSRTLLGPLTSGRVLPGCRTLRVTPTQPARPGEASLALRVRNVGEEPATLRRVAFPEGGLTLWWTSDGRLRAGVVDVRLHAGHAEASCDRPALGEGAVVLRTGRAGTSADERGFRWLLDATRRSMGAG